MKLSAIRPNPTNPRLIKEERFKALVRSLEHLPDFSAVNALKLDENNQIVGGNMRFKAMKHLGWKWATVQVYDREYHAQTISFLELGKSYEDVIREMIIKDNRSFGEDDFDILANEWDAEELNEWGLDVWTGEPEETEGLTDPDDIPDVPQEAKTKLGDLYILGEHRVLCGDSTKAEDVERLMDGQKADISFTSPPYNGNITFSTFSKNNQGKLYAEGYKDNLPPNEYIEFTQSVLKKCFEYTDGFVVWNVNYNAKSRCEYIKQISPFLDNLIEQVCWKKSSVIPYHEGLNRSWEPIYIFKSKTDENFGIKGEVQSNLWEVSNSGANHQDHRGCFPVELPERVLSTAGGNKKTMLDLFLGTGTTLIACEKKGSKCYGMELDPKYCDVIVKRWEDFTGKKAELWKQ